MNKIITPFKNIYQYIKDFISYNLAIIFLLFVLLMFVLFIGLCIKLNYSILEILLIFASLVIIIPLCILAIFPIIKIYEKIKYLLSVVEGFFVLKKKKRFNCLKAISLFFKSTKFKQYCLNYYKVKDAFANTYYGRFGKCSQKALNESLYHACTEGSLNEVRYLLTSKELKKHAKINARTLNNSTAFEHVCGVGHLEIVKYLLFSDELIEHADIHSDNDYGIVQACRNAHLDIMAYFIFDLNIEKSIPIKEYLDDSPPQGVNELFETRKMQQELEKELHYNHHKSKKIKL